MIDNIFYTETTIITAADYERAFIKIGIPGKDTD
jgi:hypothetical protein